MGTGFGYSGRSAALLVFSLFLAACGVENAPTAGSGPVPLDGQFLLTFSPDTAQRVAKLAAIPEEGRSDSKVFDLTGGQITIRDRAAKEKKRLITTLAVPPLAVAEPVLITMTVYGNTLSELVIAFAPEGLIFSLPASLQIEIGRKRVDLPLDQLIAWHIHGDGSAEQARILSVHLCEDGDPVDEEDGEEDESGGDKGDKGDKDDGVDCDSARILISVPGFSRYSLGGGLRL
jgi:hypothetical protein